MEESSIILAVISLACIIIFLFIIILMNVRWVLFGSSIMWGKFTKKGNIGLLFIRNKANNFTIPLVVDLAADEHTEKNGKDKNTYPIHREIFEDGFRFFGLPSAMFNDDDCKTALGIAYHKTDENGMPLYSEKSPDSPVISWVKNSVSLSPSMLKALVDEKSLTNALKAFLDKNQMMIYMLMGSIIAGGAAAYFGFELMSNQIPLIENTLTVGFENVNNKLDAILEAVR